MSIMRVIIFIYSYYTLCYCFLLLFFFLMIRRPPRSTLFPTRRSSDLQRAYSRDLLQPSAGLVAAGDQLQVFTQARSEEHTSELQSPCNLVCRLLLEKKKKKS